MTITFCPVGWRLYTTWAHLLETHAPRAEAKAAEREYIAHRKACQECSPWLEKWEASNDND